MKVKLLKKIRKRFDWYINSKGFPILIDKRKKDSLILDLDEVKNYYRVDDDFIEKKLQVSVEEWSWRCLKNRILKPFGFSFGNINYTKAVRRSKINKNWSKDES